MSTKGYQSIGSFHSENLADLIKASDDTYIAPALPFSDDVREVVSSPYSLDLQQWTFLNHGAFGAALTVGTRRAEQWRHYLERQPLRFFDRTLLPHLAYSTRRLSQFVNLSRREEMALIPNVTAGMNSIISSYFREYGKSGHVILWDTSYGSVKKMAHHYGSGAVTKIPFQRLYLNALAESSDPEQVFLRALHDCLNYFTASPEPLVILDHVSSNTALTFPIEKLASAIRRWNPHAIIVVDGAHGLLAQPLDLDGLYNSGVDFYLSNAHKWLSAPRGVAFMAVNHYELLWKDILHPAVYSHGGDADDLLSRFVWDGTRDYAAALSLPVVLDFWEQQDPFKVRDQIRQKLREGIRILANYWHPDFADDTDKWPGNITLTNVNSTVLSSPMILVKLPFQSDHMYDSSDAKAVQDYLYSKYIEAPIKCINGELYVRVSYHIYNISEDFVMLAKAIQSFPAVR
ncbi:hypothetical protein FisN_24Hh184 [Fistulifera solaris]|jgi:selenocysteine lyase/cysteine desulfurase|uniref:Aminotransferase class V domain-containing protein n=1 Tax=Fistulifera solaris TaxID=1519565 RepID=A0A1Z5JUP7_FISSO|nr:hypothetical protein FisN_24Hh184 [Fistulifera solaris]|eukprot:GAX17750.1 hypothetical protein FisN_24Hh184 [Fistulifera solaris]